jgi:phosphohistidine phosphatase SixA
MKVIFVRHARKAEAQDHIEDAERSIAASEVVRAGRLRDRLIDEELQPHFILTSRYRHARETAELLRCPLTRAVVEVSGLTPHTDPGMFSLAAILHEASASNVAWKPSQVLVCVGHEERLSNLRLVNSFTLTSGSEPTRHVTVPPRVRFNRSKGLNFRSAIQASRGAREVRLA